MEANGADQARSLEGARPLIKECRMLVLSRKKGEAIVISVDGQRPIEIVVVEVRGDKASIGIQADREVTVHRQEIYDLIHKETSE